MKPKKPLMWSNILFIVGYHVLLAALLPLYFIFFNPTWTMFGISFALLYATGMAITAGYHRLFSHLTYKTNKWVEATLLFFGTMATQGSAIRWSYDHRLHHAHIDKDDDPYSVTRGFWHAHILWMFRKQDPIDKKVVADLYRNKLLVFQHKHFELLMVITNTLMTLLIGWATGDYFGAFVVSWLLRQFLLHHFTWFINSLAHYWGHQNYSTEHTAVDNYILCMLTFGEGYHNYHHTFAYDYRNGIKWYHFDPTKWLIWTLNKLGLAKGLRKVEQARISKAMIKEHKRALIEKLQTAVTSKKAELEEKAAQLADSLTDNLAKMNELIQKYKKSRQDMSVIPSSIKALKKEISSLRRSLKKEWSCWRKFSRQVMKLKAA